MKPSGMKVFMWILRVSCLFGIGIPYMPLGWKLVAAVVMASTWWDGQ